MVDNQIESGVVIKKAMKSMIYVYVKKESKEGKQREGKQRDGVHASFFFLYYITAFILQH
ncbi:hypothetical protein TZ02_08125 [Clostridium aceticum]|nr:hypothetical protein TZ02_08125 [Clostridium aceticum]